MHYLIKFSVFFFFFVALNYSMALASEAPNALPKQEQSLNIEKSLDTKNGDDISESRGTTYSSLLTLNIFNVALLLGGIVLLLTYLGIPASAFIGGRSLAEKELPFSNIMGSDWASTIFDYIEKAVEAYERIQEEFKDE